MVALLIVALPLTVTSLWLYLRFAPAGTTLQGRARFECCVMLAVVAGCAGVGGYAHATVGQGVDRAWWPIIAFAYGVFLIPAVLVLAALARKLVYGKRRPAESSAAGDMPKAGPGA
jgi:hypothetical protein